MKNFSWIVENQLAGMAKPGFFKPLNEDVLFLKEKEIAALVCLAEEFSDGKFLADAGMEVLHIPVPNMTAPQLEQIEKFVDFVEKKLKDGKKVAVHCLYGLGRTGTMLACYLVKQGFTPWDAISEVRKKRPGSVETEEQAAAVYKYYNVLHAG